MFDESDQHATKKRLLGSVDDGAVRVKDFLTLPTLKPAAKSRGCDA